ncbi:MAG: hypothetical protein ABIK98_06140 [Pseudomonadota bacterium]|uniref:Uncharacterized protein n=1 Tax=Candidatus Desulfatibia profunda TaxID=2841695 RepID=A0A8J6TL74_9BACT|nr:hypothetical protein [Candidatus Desulfatibia profunda]MBL7178745.1 hypothetical protein [Desulfobacterales bacterium]
MSDNTSVGPINNLDCLEELLNAGYVINGPRKDPQRDLISFKAFLKKGKEFVPEVWLSNMGYEFVEPSTFTKGHKIAYKMIDELFDERFNSNYTMVKGKREIPLYLKVAMPKAE